MHRRAGLIRLLSLAVAIIALLVLTRSLPIDLQVLEAAVARLGAWGPVAFVFAYILATVLFLPGLPLTLAAGALFGPVLGTAVVSAGSTLGAAATFLIGRYLARDRVRAMVEKYERARAIDAAIETGGVRVVAMLRLSPAVPFNLQNSAGRTGLAEWALRLAGLVATIVVTVYITRLARRALARPADVSGAVVAPEPATAGRPWGTAAMVVIATLLVAVAVYVQFRPHAVERLIGALFGPPAVTIGERYPDDAGGATFDHTAYDELLERHVSAGGWVDYAGLSRDHAQLEGYIAAIGRARFDELGRDEKLALLLNAYNAFTLELIVESYPIASIRDIPAEQRWGAVRWEVGGDVVSLEQLEHERIRPRFAEPRVHFALVCAAIGCPVLRRAAYIGARLDQQLTDQMRECHQDERWFRLEPGRGVVHLTRLYDWYGGDFEQSAGSVLEFVARYAAPLKVRIDAGKTPEIAWLPYDWALNDVKNRP